MFSLKAIDETLKLSTSTGADIDVSVTWADMDGVSGVEKSTTETKITTATTTTILDAPDVDVNRTILSAFIRNVDSITNVVTIIKDVGGTEYAITASISLLAGEVIEYNNFTGWKHIDSDGKFFFLTGSAGGWTDVTVTDADFVAADNTRYYLPASVLTTNRSVDMSGVTTQVKFVIEEDRYILAYTGASVYGWGGSEARDALDGRLTTTIEKVSSKLIIVS
jgi:hypothetical protein